MSQQIAAYIYIAGVLSYTIGRLPFMIKSLRVSGFKHDIIKERLLVLIAASGMVLIPCIHLYTYLFIRFEHDFLELNGWLGLLLTVTAMFIFFKSHIDLGAQFSPVLELKRGHRLVTHGIYRHVRHPMYTAFWLYVFAQSLLLPNWIAGFSGIVGFGALYLSRIKREEDMMFYQFGDEYRFYYRETGRLLPKLKKSK